MLEKLSAVFTCIRESGMKLATDKCAFGLKEFQFLGNTITSEGLTPIKQKIATFLRTFKMPKNVKQTKRMIGFFNFYKAFIPELGEKLLPFYRLLKKETDFEINEEHNIMLKKLTQDLQSACEISLRLPMTNRQCHYGRCIILCCRICINDRGLHPNDKRSVWTQNLCTCKFRFTYFQTE